MMLPAPTCLNEAARLVAVAEYDVAGSPAEPAFADLLRVTKRLFKVSTTFVSIVEQDRQLFFSKVGIDACQTGRDIAFCSHTIALDRSLVVLDARMDPRFYDNPLVIGEPYIRFYVGIPLRAPSGHPIGALCLVDPEPRNCFSGEDLSSLSDVASLISNLLESRRLELARHVSQSRFESIAATSPDGIICADSNGIVTVWNDATSRLFGYTANDAIGQSLDLIVPVELRGRHSGGMKRVVQGGAPTLIGKTIELAARHRDGTEFPIELSLSMWREEGLLAFGAIVRDLRERRVVEERLFRLTCTDSLTNLPNRAVLCERTADALRLGKSVAVLLIDLDHFKGVVNTLGHHAGEQLLQAAATALMACVAPTDTVARLQEDEFALMMSDCADANSAGRVADRINHRLALPQTIDGQKVVVSASVGIAMSGAGMDTAEELLSCADLALLQARAAGGHCARVFISDMKQSAIHKRSDRDDLHRATQQGEFELFYQPQVSLLDGTLVGAEALLRWRHPDKGLLAPGAFLAALETSRYAGEVGHWVLQEACRQAKRWREFAPTFRVGVNLFGAQCRTGDLAERVFETLEQSQLPVAGLEIEITENIILQHDERQVGTFRALRDAGIGIAFDDYGTGYASLSQLKLFPLTRLKIDQTFTRGMCDNKQDAAIVRAIILLSRSFELDVIAEGVETPEQQARLIAKGCIEAQGYLFAKPMPASAFEQRYGFGDPTQADTASRAA